MRLVKLLAACGLATVFEAAVADPGLLRLTFTPSVCVADGRSTVTVTAEVRDSAGRTAADGTEVMLSTTLGNFRQEVVPAYGGYARGILVAGSTPGIAKITATAISMSASDVEEFEFVSDRAALSAAKEYIDLSSPQSLSYNPDQRTLAASAPHQGVSLKFRDIEIHADDVQVNVPLYEVRARNASVRIAKAEAHFNEVYLVLNARKGFGMTTYVSRVPLLVPFMDAIRFEPRERKRYGLAEIRSSGVGDPSEVFSVTQLEFADLSAATSMVYAKRAIAFPRKEIQFHHAVVYVAGVKVQSLPLYDVSLAGSALVTEQYLNVNNNQVAVNYPYYLRLEPGFTSLFRFTTGENYGRTVTASRGEFLSYEMTWDRGDLSDGGLNLTGIGRPDWDLGVQQTLRPDDRTNAFVQGDYSGQGTVFGAGNISRSFPGFSANLTGSSSRTITGIPYSDDQASLSLEKDPAKVGKLPLRWTIGAIATDQQSTASATSATQSGVGLQSRLQMLPQHVDRMTTVFGSLTASSLVGQNTNGGFGLVGNLTWSRQFFAGASGIFSYDFADDGYTSDLLGKHRINMQLFYGVGRVDLNSVIERSLDIERSTYLFDASLRLSNLWHFSCNFTLDNYLGQQYQDYYLVLAYRLGIRDVGLVYSGTTNRIGIQILGATFN
jgi:hypothetical protein